jgi:hypothetical protein
MTESPTKPKPPEPTDEEIQQYQRDQGRMDGWRNEPKEKDEKRK